MNMVTQQEAEAMAKAAIEKYLTDCKLEDETDAGNALMKLVSLAGVFMCATVGQADAVARLQGTTDFIASPAFSGPWTKQRVQ